MARRYIDLSEQAFVLINGPLLLLSLTANTFYACCLIFPCRNRKRLKQPLKTLLGSLVCCSIVYCVSLPLHYYVLKNNKSFGMFVISWVIVTYLMYNSMTCYVWLNFFCYIQIVPAQRAVLIWAKRNIRSVIYKALLFDMMLFFFNSAVDIADATFFISSSFSHINSTWTGELNDGLYLSRQVCFFIIKVHILICLCILTVSSFSTANYLHRHMRNMAQSGSGFSTPRIQGRMRVAITGISQGVLYFLYDTFHLFDSFTLYFSPHFFLSGWVSLTVTSLYISGTTVNLGIGQIIFRQRAADLWRALKALCGVGIVTSDVKVHSGQLTSGEITNNLSVIVQTSL